MTTLEEMAEAAWPVIREGRHEMASEVVASYVAHQALEAAGVPALLEERSDLLAQREALTAALRDADRERRRLERELRPGKWHWSRWRLVGWLAIFLYRSGIMWDGGTISSYTGDGPFYSLPSWRSVAPYWLRPSTHRGGRGHMRPYALWLPRWWWQCHRRQGWRLWRHHRPYKPAAFGICGRCLPCQECGSPERWCACLR